MSSHRKLLQRYLNRESNHRDIYHDMMPFKVKEILLVSSLYDAFFIEREGRFAEIMLYDYGNMNLTSVPRITGVTSAKEVLEQLEKKEIDMVVMMVGINKVRPITISKKIKKRFPEQNIFFLINNV